MPLSRRFKSRLVLVAFVWGGGLLSGCRGKIPFDGTGVPESMGSRMYRERGTSDAPSSAQSRTSPTTDSHGLLGKCYIESEVHAEMPCHQGEVVLLDENKKPLGKSGFDEGEFFFSILKDKMYFLTVRAKSYELSPTFAGPYEFGDSVLLKLKKKPK